MRRHLVFARDFDNRARVLDEIQDAWEPRVKELHMQNQRKLIRQLKRELGIFDFQRKLENFKNAGIAPFSIISYHNDFYRQARYSFIFGLYYPALTSACALGERILNHLMIDLRESFKSSPHYKNIYRKNSFDDWGTCINILSDWGVFQHDGVLNRFHSLKDLRMRSIHFNGETYANLRHDALSALELLRDIISFQFGSWSGQKWMIPGTEGHVFIKKESENDPFIQKFYLPQSPLVGPYFSMRHEQGQWIVFDKKDYSGEDLSDEEFCRTFNSRHSDSLVDSSMPWSEDIIARVVLGNKIHELGYRE